MKPTSEALKAGKSAAGSNSARRARIMIVDNHPLMREGLAAVVNREPDMEVCCQFNTAAEGLAHLDKQRPDLLVTGLSLPGRGGIE